MPDSAKFTPKATVAIKVIRADGTEESFVSEDVTVTDAKAVTKLINSIKKDGD